MISSPQFGGGGGQPMGIPTAVKMPTGMNFRMTSGLGSPMKADAMGGVQKSILSNATNVQAQSASLGLSRPSMLGR